ncbi:MAG: hypothetical protein LRS48_02015 [Desulfurococcales archaeon]|nr:hypothetical protein [Desulfurococcales archaeon]
MPEEKPEEKNNVEIKIEKPPLGKLLATIPPASSLKARQKKISEKRIRLKYDYSLEREEAKINPSLARTLGITDLLEITVARRHRFVFKAIVDDSVEEDRVHVNPDLMEEHGIADNSIATVRAYKGSEKLGVRLSV